MRFEKPGTLTIWKVVRFASKAIFIRRYRNCFHVSHLSSHKALVLFSGGQDSTTCLAWALDRYKDVYTIGFDYGQRNAVELECRSRIRERLPAIADWKGSLEADHLVGLDFLPTLVDSALTSDRKIEMDESGLPTTFVPGRNLMFLTVAAALAYGLSTRHIVGGMCETDFSGYPDCRDDAIKSLQVALNVGMDSRFVIETPLMWLDKADSWELARQLGGEPLVDLIRRDTHTCYVGDRTTDHEWGSGCGGCPACEIRRDGYLAFRGRSPA